jgi:hypothetical protein
MLGVVRVGGNTLPGNALTDWIGRNPNGLLVRRPLKAPAPPLNALRPAVPPPGVPREMTGAPTTDWAAAG